MLPETDAVRVAAALLAVIVVAGSIYFFVQLISKGKFHSRKTELNASSKHPEDKPSTAAGQPNVTPDDSTPPSESADAWEVRRRRGIPAASLHVKKDAESEKPFGSSYYYAHNSSKTTGGYKDGLRMEDFTMNGPRLLSRGGKAVDDSVLSSSISSNHDTLTPSSNVSLNRKASSDLKRTLPITRYLWDDPGDSKGMATIRIDELPGKTSAETVAWKDINASITHISAALILDDEGMLVKIETSGDVDYQLRIPKLYGSVTQVEAISKSKRLLVRLKKKSGLFDKSNLKAWPHPQKKTS